MNRTSLRVLRESKLRRKVAGAAERELVVTWNALCPPGTRVRYYPIWGRWGEHHDEVMDRPASILPSGSAVLWLSGVTGCVSARHCEPAELHPSAGAVAAAMNRAELAPQDLEQAAATAAPELRAELAPEGGPHAH